MSRSKKKPILKDKPRNTKASIYYRKIRRVIKHLLTKTKNSGDPIDLNLPESRSLVNDYDYCDWIWNMEDEKDPERKDKYSRK